MSVKAKRMAFAGLLLAMTVLCMFLGGVIETNTLFLLAAASYFVGVVIREAGAGYGGAFFIAAVALGLITAPNKFYVLSFAAMGLYIIIYELSSHFIWKIKKFRHRGILFWLVKYIAFNLMFLPILFKFQQILFGKTLSPAFLAGAALFGQLAVYIFDRAYLCFLRDIWGRIRKITVI